MSIVESMPWQLRCNAICGDCGRAYAMESFEIKTSFGWHRSAARCKDCAKRYGLDTQDT